MPNYRELGNEHFKAGRFKEAEQQYTDSILTVSRNDPKVFSNRSLARIRLQDWEGAESDARKAIELYSRDSNSISNKNDNITMKSRYYLAQALLAQRRVGEALTEAMHAYSICLETKDSSSEVISQFILRAKQTQWQAKETLRLREMNNTLALVETVLDERLQQDLKELEERFQSCQIGVTGRNEEKAALEKEAEERLHNIRAAFSSSTNTNNNSENTNADNNNSTTTQHPSDFAERVVPDHLIDPITFEIMHDPVITPSGSSYERVSLLKHLRAHGTDPLTRLPLTEKQIYPNMALRNACSEFLENNGWAVDW